LLANNGPGTCTEVHQIEHEIQQQTIVMPAIIVNFLNHEMWLTVAATAK
jgi:hypothetical protein